jgi:RNA polymerase sigma factor (sigma-70 family)
MHDLANPNERLLERASKGDHRAFSAIFERYHQRLYRYCVAIVGNSEDARDALQNTMVRVLAALPGERRKLELEPWLYRIAHNEAIEIVRRRRPAADIDSIDPVGEMGADARVESRERLRGLIEDLRELPERQRSALLMRELGGLGFDQIGEALETSGRAARQTVYEARVGLQDMEGGRAMACDEVRRRLSDGDRRLIRRRDVRAHLRHCASCRDFEQAIAARRSDLAAIAPLPALAAGGILQTLLGGAAGGAAGPGAGAAGAGALGKVVGGSVLAKAVATGAVVAAIGVAAADRSGLVDVVPGGSTQHASSGPAGPTERSGPAVSPAAGAAGSAASRQASAAGASTPVRRSRAARSGGGRSTSTPARQGESTHAAHGAPAGSKARGAGATNSHGGNPNANPKAAVKANSGHHGGRADTGAHAPQHGAPPLPKSQPHAEAAEKPEPPAEGQGPAPGQAAGQEAHGHAAPDSAASAEPAE